jgi:hypothetical protein
MNDPKLAALRLLRGFDGYDHNSEVENRENMFSPNPDFDQWYTEESEKYKKNDYYDFGEYEDLKIAYVVDEKNVLLVDNDDNLFEKYSHIVNELVCKNARGYVVLYAHNRRFSDIRTVIDFVKSLDYCACMDCYDIELVQEFAGTKYHVVNHDTESG